MTRQGYEFYLSVLLDEKIKFISPSTCNVQLIMDTDEISTSKTSHCFIHIKNAKNRGHLN